MSSIDQQFIEYVVKALVSNPEAVLVERRIDEKGVLLELTVDPEDLGRVIGKRGATAQSLRTLLRALGTKNDARYNLKIVDNGIESATDGLSGDNTASDDQHASHANQAIGATSTSASGASVVDDSDDHTSHQPSRPAVDESDDNSRVSKTRRELQELDDLDV